MGGKSFDEMCDVLTKYRNREGHCNVPTNHKEEGKNLGRWLCDQRRLKKKGNLNSGRQEVLERLGVQWEVQRGKSFDVMCDVLTKYRNREGHCNVPHPHKEEG